MRYFVNTIAYNVHVVLPLSIGGAPVSLEEAADAYTAGEIKDAGTYKDFDDAKRRCEKLNTRGK